MKNWPIVIKLCLYSNCYVIFRGSFIKRVTRTVGYSFVVFLTGVREFSSSNMDNEGEKLKCEYNDPESVLLPILRKHINYFEMTESNVFGYIDGDENFERFTTEVAAAGCSYSTRSSEALKSGKFLFSAMKGDVPIQFFKCPFQVLKVIHYECAHGGTYIPRKASHASNQDKKRRKLLNPTKKIGCEAKMVCKKVLVYPNFVAVKNHWMAKKEVLTKLRLELPFNPTRYVRYYLAMSHPKKHNHFLKFSSLSLNLNRVLIDKIYELVSHKITNPKQIKIVLEGVVERMFQESNTKPDIFNSAFFPSVKTIRNHVVKATMAMKKIDSNNDTTFIVDSGCASEDNFDQCDESSEKKFTDAERKIIKSLHNKCLEKLEILDRMTREIESKSHLQDLTEELKECISKYTGHIRKKKTANLSKLLKKEPARELHAIDSIKMECEVEEDVGETSFKSVNNCSFETNDILPENKDTGDTVKMFIVLDNT